ncbi:MAG: NYN domain-containing protein [Verrucomicrobia bacterium]|nr:NYN domain-containing protein [Verrucomicrobiota bacterium]MBV9275284.1 NYN domain-containing protein [Verrucomicrobiota bacterium]
MSERVLIVDGHSIIFAWPELLALHQRKTATARDSLVKTLTEYQDTTGTHVVVVFDGKGTMVNQIDEPGGIQIFYSNTGRTADEIVERLVAKYAKAFSITVATADLLEQQTVTSFGAQPIGSEGLRRMIQDAQNELAAELKRRRRNNR